MVKSSQVKLPFAQKLNFGASGFSSVSMVRDLSVLKQNMRACACVTWYNMRDTFSAHKQQTSAYFPCTRSDSSSRMHSNFLPSADEKAAAGKQAAQLGEKPG